MTEVGAGVFYSCMRPMISIALFVLLGCSATGPSSQLDLAQNRRLWEARRIRSYDVDVDYSSDWVRTQRWRIEVRSGIVSRVIDRSSGEVIGPSAERPRWPTVDTLFAIAERFLEDPEAVVELRFHRALNYPTAVSRDHPKWADDAEWYAAANLVSR